MTFTITRDETFSDRLKRNLAKRYKDKKRNILDPIHVTDLIGRCIRKSFYERINDQEELDDVSVHNFVRGELSERIILELANINANQVEVKLDGIIGHIDAVMDSEKGPIAIELKDTVSFTRLGPNEDQFRKWLNQLLAYMCMSEDIENGILSIRYNVWPMLWQKRDSDKTDFFMRKYDAAPIGTEAWAVHLSKDDILRKQQIDELVGKKNIFLEALSKDGGVSLLPRLRGRNKLMVCKSCNWYNSCWNIDTESDSASRMANQVDPLDKVLIQPD